MRPWKCLSSKAIVDRRWLRITEDKCELPSGIILDSFFVIHESEWVHILALDAEDRILVVRQYRYAGNSVCTELPGGAVDLGEDLLVAAQRELLEETGYQAAQWEYIGWLFANPARQTNRVHLFFARELSRSSTQTLDVSEDIEFEFLDQASIQHEIEAGRFSQALHVASYYRAMYIMADRREA